MQHSTRDLKKALEAAYSTLSPFSDSAQWEFNSHLTHLGYAVSLLDNFPQGASVMDVGCYIGVLPLALRNLGYDASGNDKYIFYSRESGNAYGFTDSELATLKTIWSKHGLVIESVDVAKERSSKTYDVVLSIATLEHQPYPKLFLENIASFAHPGSYIYIATPNAVKLANRFRIFLGRPPMSNVDEFYTNAEHFNGHWREYTPHEVAAMGRLSGLEVVEATAKQTEPVGFRFDRPKKWARSIARLLAHYIPGTGDSVLVIFKK